MSSFRQGGCVAISVWPAHQRQSWMFALPAFEIRDQAFSVVSRDCELPTSASPVLELLWRSVSAWPGLSCAPLRQLHAYHCQGPTNRPCRPGEISMSAEVSVSAKFVDFETGPTLVTAGRELPATRAPWRRERL